MKTSIAILATAFSTAALWQPPVDLAAQDSRAAISGMVSSTEEGAMEGVVVSARRSGANFTVSVVSDARGRFNLPRTHLEPGTYALTMKATGYDLVDPGPVTVVAGKTTARDLSLVKTQDLSRQLSSREWVLSMPGTDDQKRKLVAIGTSCTYCHSLERIIKSKHTADEFVPIITRMARYFEDGTAVPTGTGRAKATLKEKERLEAAAKSTMWFADASKAELGSYLASVNLSGGRTEPPFPLKTLPRPTGIATRAIVTTWEIPRKDAVAHDSDVDSKGRVWYNEENSWVVGVLDPKTNTFTEYPLNPMEQTPGIAGARDIFIDKSDKVWLPIRKGSGTALHKFDPATKALTKIEGTEGAGSYGDISWDGKHVWLGFVRVDTRTGKVDGDFRRPPNLPEGARQASGYGFAVNTKGNPYGTDFMGSRIVGVDVRKNEIAYWPTMRPNTYPRRGRIDSRDRFWVGIYGGDAIAMLDTRTGRFQEWKMPTPYTTPYTATVPDRHGYVYSSSNTSERLLRLNPKTGEVVEFPMPNGPGNFDPKKMAFDPTTKKSVLLFANTRNGEIMRVEMPD